MIHRLSLPVSAICCAGDSDGAQKLLDRLAQLAPESTAYQSSRTAMLLSTPQGRQSLQEARLLATTGHTEQAIASYDKLFKGYPPEGELAVEYWTTVAKLPARRHEAINQLQKINAVSPGNNALQNALAQLLFASGRRDEGFAVLKQMAKSSTGRSAASAIWYQQIKDLPVSDASVKALQDYLTQFSEGDSVSAARAQLSEQQKQLADPAFRARSQGIAAVNAGEGGKAIAQLQQAVSARQDDSEAVGALGQAYSQRGDRARAVAQFEKALAMAPHSSSRDKWESLLKVNRYWLLIQQGDAALKANNLARAERFYQQARAVDNTDSYAVLGLGMWRWRAKIMPPPNVIISRRCVWIAVIPMLYAGWRIFIASSRRKKPPRLSLLFPPASGAVSTISNAVWKMTVWRSRRKRWKARANGRRPQNCTVVGWH